MFFIKLKNTREFSKRAQPATLTIGKKGVRTPPGAIFLPV